MISDEIGGGDARVLDRCNRGSLPSILDSDTAKRDLDAYVGIYLKEEIQAEALTRSIENFSRVLNFSAHLNAQQINYTKIGNDAQVPPRTVKDYFQVFSDTLIAHIIPPFQKTSKRKAVSTEKFYFFDLGVAKNLARRGDVSLGTPEFGQSLEHLILLEIMAYRDYQGLDSLIQYWRSQSQIEVDFILNENIGIEVKASAQVSPQDLKGLRALQEDADLQRKIVVSSERERRTVEGIEIIPYGEFLRDLWAGKIIV